MGLLKNIFGKKSELFHREVRVYLYHSEVFFKAQHTMSSSLIDVVNISVTGVALEKEKLKDWPKVGEIIPGRLFVKEFSMEVSIRIVHFTNKIVGCAFVDLPDGFEAKLKDFLKVEFS